jgi:hypothetical protein
MALECWRYCWCLQPWACVCRACDELARGARHVGVGIGLAAGLAFNLRLARALGILLAASLVNFLVGASGDFAAGLGWGATHGFSATLDADWRIARFDLCHTEFGRRGPLGRRCEHGRRDFRAGQCPGDHWLGLVWAVAAITHLAGRAECRAAARGGGSLRQ